MLETLLVLASWLIHFVKHQITLQRTEQNNPLGLEVQLHITEAIVPALSEPGKLLLTMKLKLFLQLLFVPVKPKMHFGQVYGPFFDS
jgi:hypothetical protein